jgi:hypothetical protein
LIGSQAVRQRYGQLAARAILDISVLPHYDLGHGHRVSFAWNLDYSLLRVGIIHIPTWRENITAANFLSMRMAFSHHRANGAARPCTETGAVVIRRSLAGNSLPKSLPKPVPNTPE